MRLCEVLKQWRWAAKRNARDAARDIGISVATLYRLENGLPCDGSTLAKILQWLLAEGTQK